VFAEQVITTMDTAGKTMMQSFSTALPSLAKNPARGLDMRIFVDYVSLRVLSQHDVEGTGG
jgi:hypothetical protein